MLRRFGKKLRAKDRADQLQSRAELEARHIALREKLLNIQEHGMRRKENCIGRPDALSESSTTNARTGSNNATDGSAGTDPTVRSG